MPSRKPTEDKGARFYKADLHLHTPASKDCEDKKKTAEDYVRAAIQKGLEIIAVTDHNTADWVDSMREAASGTPLHVFPGVEVTTPICHLLVLFDLDCTKSRIEEFLTTVGVTGEMRGKQEAMAQQPEDILQAAKTFGALVIAAHANSSNGLLKHGKGQYRQKIFHEQGLAAMEFASPDDVEAFCSGRISGYAPKACVQGSDAHDPSKLGQRVTHFKMDGVSLRGLRQALLDYEVRVRFDWNLPRATYPQIKRLTLSQGFLANLVFDFHPNLNCFVGGKGVGKSTVVELMRYCFDDISSIQEITEDNAGKVATLLGDGGKVKVEYFDADGETKVVEREVQTWETQRTVRTLHGAATEILTAPVFFSQGELTRIAANPIAQLELLDRYLDISTENSTEASIVVQLGDNAAQLQAAIHRQSEMKEELEDKATGVAVTKLKYKTLEQSLKDAVLKSFPKWESEKRYLTNVAKGLDLLELEFQKAVDQIDFKQMFPTLPESDSPNHALLKKATEAVGSLKAIVGGTKRLVADAIASKTSEITRIRKEWEPKFAAKQEEYEKVLDALGEIDLRRAQANMRGLRQRLDELEQKEKEIGGAAEEIELGMTERTGLLAKLREVRASRYKKRKEKAAEWQAAFKGKIKIEVNECGDRGAYFESLRNLARGANIRETDLKYLTQNIDPSDFVNMVRADDVQLLAERAQIKPENARKLIATLQSKEPASLLSIESTGLPDSPTIEYEVEPGRYKSLRQLSVGQKGTVIISLALIEGQPPLIIDQPEEPLDTLAIHDQVVGTLRRQKDERQFIFTTHNANVAVGADAELSYVLDASADAGVIKASGGIDQEQTNRLLLLHLEGGAEALAVRSRKYLL
jgi:energy-coupling factor transporter ATP-binding protein EcfA2